MNVGKSKHQKVEMMLAGGYGEADCGLCRWRETKRGFLGQDGRMRSEVEHDVQMLCFFFFCSFGKLPGTVVGWVGFLFSAKGCTSSRWVDEGG